MEEENPRLTPEEIKALEMLGYFYMSMGMWESAERCVKALFLVDRDNDWVKGAWAALSFRMGRHEEVLHMTQGLPMPGPSDPPLLFEMLKLRARALYRLGREKEGEELMKKVMGK